MSKIKKLKPCPFCGGEATLKKTMDEDLWSHNIVPYYKVGCSECEIWTEFTCKGYEPSAQETWNKRFEKKGKVKKQKGSEEVNENNCI